MVSARRHPRRVHVAQRDDPRLPVEPGLGPDSPISPAMRRGARRICAAYFERLEDCHHRPLDRLRSKLGVNPSRHGYGGWLLDREVGAGGSDPRREDPPTLRRVNPQRAERSRRPDAARASRALAIQTTGASSRKTAFGTCYTPMTTRNYSARGRARTADGGAESAIRIG